MPVQNQMRLNKYLAESGVCSRREADKLIAEGRVTINGKAAALGASVHDGVEVAVNGKLVQKKQKHVVLAYYKPLGVTCTEKDRHAEKTITEALKYPVRVTYAGRLDKDSEGLMLMTDDGDLIHAMMQGSNRHEKEYLVKVNKEVSNAHIRSMADGMYLKELEQHARPCAIGQVGKFTYRVILTQGLNRQIRRMFHQLGYHVVAIRRVRVLNITLGSLRPGMYRVLEGEELAELYRQTGLTCTASGTADGGGTPDRPDKGGRAQTAGRTNRAEDRERTARPDRTDKSTGVRTVGRTNRAGDRERTVRADRTDKNGRAQKQGKTDRIKRTGRNGDRQA